MFLSALTSCAQKHSAGGLFEHERTQSKISLTDTKAADSRGSAAALVLQGGTYFPHSFTVALQDVLQQTDDTGAVVALLCLELHVAVERRRRFFRVYSRRAVAADGGKTMEALAAEVFPHAKLSGARARHAALHTDAITAGYVPVLVRGSSLGAAHVAASKEATCGQLAGSRVGSEEVGLSEHLHREGHEAFCKTIGARVTPSGVETSSGVLTLSAIDKAEAALKQLYDAFVVGESKNERYTELIAELKAALPMDLEGLQAGLATQSEDDVASGAFHSHSAFVALHEALGMMREMLEVRARPLLRRYATDYQQLLLRSARCAKCSRCALDRYSTVTFKPFRRHRSTRTWRRTARASGQRRRGYARCGATCCAPSPPIPRKSPRSRS